MPQVSLINYDGIGHSDKLFAAKMLAFTKNTRLNMTPDALEQFFKKPDQEILDELKYMSTSIPSSWEFCDVTFLITQVSRATAQQMTRTRTGSYAMQSQRVNDMSGVTFDPLNPDYQDQMCNVFEQMMLDGIQNYKQAVEGGVPLEDARDILPIGVHCNLVAKYNLRSFVDLIRARNSLRVQGPYVSIADKMKSQVLSVWPWAETFFVPKQQKSIDIIEAVALELKKLGGESGAMYKGLSGQLAKAADLLKKE